MSSLMDNEKRYLEKLFGMSDGYFLDYKDHTFGELFNRHNIDIHGRKYQTFGTSKAKKFRAFWTLESDRKVGMVLSEILDSYEAKCIINHRQPERNLLEKARSIAGRLSNSSDDHCSASTESEFLARKFSIPNIQKMLIDAQVVPIIETRLKETEIAFAAGAHLSVIFLCGSVLEAALLGRALHDSKRFNQTKATPKQQRVSRNIFKNGTLLS